MVRTDPAYNSFVNARNALKSYEASHSTQTKEQRLNDPKYLSLFNTFKTADKAGAEAKFCVNG